MEQYLLAEFTGERVIPGLVEDDLWNEHIARYLFASSLSPGKRVLDVGCGAGYGTDALAQTASQAVGFDISPEAVAYANDNFAKNATFCLGDATDFPAADNSFDLIVAFEVIEHLTDWPKLITEAARVVADDGLFLVSTPNKSYYAETRREQGPNPFHIHEFVYGEFHAALHSVFPFVHILTQNQTQAITFSGDETGTGTGVAFGQVTEPVYNAHFFLALCSRAPIAPINFVYIPRTGNMLREREKHIAVLQADLSHSQAQHLSLLENHWKLEQDFEIRRHWAEELNEHVAQLMVERDNSVISAKRLEQEMQDLIDQRNRAAETADELRSEIAEAHRQLSVTRNIVQGWISHAQTLDGGADSPERQHRESEYDFAKLLADVEQQLRFLTEKARLVGKAHADIRALIEERDMVRNSRWIRLGRRLGLGPQLPDALP